MRIIFIIADMPGGGSERVLANLADEFVERGIEVKLMMTAGEQVAYPLNKKIEVMSLGAQSGGSILKRIKRIVKMRQIFCDNADSYFISFGTETNLFSIIASGFLPNRLIISERNDPNQCEFPKLRDLLYRFSDFFVFQTEDARDCFSGAIRQRSAVIPNPLNKELPEVFKGERRKVVAAVGRLTAQKNHALLLRAFEEFQRDFPEYQLWIYGIGELLNALKEQAETLGIEDKVRFMGFMPDVLEQIRDCSMYVLSSDYEGISNSLGEAMAVGIPVIATDCPIGGSRMCIENGKNGFLVPMQDSSTLAEVMKNLAGDKELSDALSVMASAVRDTYSVGRIADLWLEVLERDR